VGHEHEGDADVALQLLQLDLHLLAQLEVERAERLVQQQHLGPDHERAGQRDPLPLAAGELAGLAVAVAGHLHAGQRLLGPVTASGAAHLAHGQAVLDVLPDGQVREQRVVLEDRGDVALERRRPGHVRAAERHRAGGRRLEAGDHAQHRGLARAGRPQHGEELAVRDRQVDAVDRGRVAELLAEAGQVDRRSGVHAGPRIVCRFSLLRRKPMAA
jgi:hypothetical protein